MKKLVVIIAAMAFATGVYAQSPEGLKMYKYERYQSAISALQGDAASNAMANYYVGLSQLGLGNLDAAKTTFAKFPDNVANMAGMARVNFEQGKVAEGTQIATAVANMAKKKAGSRYAMRQMLLRIRMVATTSRQLTGTRRRWNQLLKMRTC